ncbi:MAG: iolB [Glaciihabitans sp.]|nr:iolB [Glaciihabitans sp.]
MQRRNEWFFPHGDLARDGWQTVVDESTPGWKHTGLRVAQIAAGDELALPSDGLERIIVPLAGSFTVTHSSIGPSETVALAGRASVFSGPTDVLYLSSVATATITGVGRIAVAEAPTENVYPTAYIAREDVPVELRGSGRSSRQVHNFGTPDALVADKLIVCEVITPAENWSSYPPHKHDEQVAGKESRLEEIYYFESDVSVGLTAPPAADPFGYMRTYSSAAGEIDIMAEVRTGDVALVPFGWHGPCVAAPGYDLYYLNVMAGPDPERAWLISDDPAHGWIRQTWEGQEFDSRLPYLAPNDTDVEGTHA